MRCLERYQLHWDGPVVYQRLRTERYRAAFESLRQEGLLYGCRCSRKELSGRLVYPGTCSKQQIPADASSVAARMAIDGRPIRFVDCLLGPQAHDLGLLSGDFIVRRRDGIYAYHLATVVDDADAEVTEVVRGSDLLDSTPRQVYLQQMLHLPTPSYAHTPLLLAPDGRKLSKQNAAPPVDTLDPSDTLIRLLGSLHHAPPAGLKGAGAGEILEWAAANWDMTRLRGIQHLRQSGARRDEFSGGV